MRFMILRKADADSEAVVAPDAEWLGAMVQFNEQLIDAGVLRTCAGLHPSSHGARLSFSGGSSTLQEGPFVEARELVAGFSVIEVESQQAALDWLARWPVADAAGEASLELRESGCAGGLAAVAAPAGAAGTPPDGKRFMVMLKGDAVSESGGVPAEAVLARMAQRNQADAAAGILLAGEGLQASARGARMKFSRGVPGIMDGPFTEAKELIAGFWIIQVADLQAAIAWAQSYPFPHDGSGAVEVEIRQVLDAPGSSIR